MDMQTEQVDVEQAETFCSKQISVPSIHNHTQLIVVVVVQGTNVIEIGEVEGNQQSLTSMFNSLFSCHFHLERILETPTYKVILRWIFFIYCISNLSARPKVGVIAICQ